MDQSVLWKLSYGLYAIGVMEGEKCQGCIVNTVFQVSSNNMIALSMSKNNHTHSLIKKEGRFSVSIITEDIPAPTIGRLGYSSGADVCKYDGLNYHMQDGLPLLDGGCAGHLICKLCGRFDTGSHTVFFAEVEDALQGSNAPVMTYAYYHTVIKAKAPKNAPTYQGE